jgi:hypothetical protein
LEILIDDQKRNELKEEIKNLRLLEDTFMTKCFHESLECTEFVLRIVLNMPDLVVKSAITEYYIKNLQGRSARLDIRAVDSKGKIYNVEVESRDKGAKPRRIRYNLCLLDSNSIFASEDVEKLPETYIIMFAGKDYWGKGKPIYKINKTVDDTGIVFNDGTHILYINGEYKDDTPLGKLIHDFNCSDAKDMYSPILAERVRYFKEDEEGVSKMCEVMENIVNKEKKEIAIKLLKSGKLSLDEIADNTGLSLDEVKKLNESLLVPA